MRIMDVLWETKLIVVSTVLSNVICTFATSMYYERQTFFEEIQIYSSYDVIFTTSRPSDAFCAWSCHKSEGCVSFFYNKGSGACVGVKEPCQVSTSKNEGEADMPTCWTMPVGKGTRQPRDCLDVLSRNQSAEDGVYSITTVEGTELDVYCVMSTRGGGWTVLLRRFNGEVPFNRTFAEYDEGFGDKAGEHWLGLRYIHEMTATVPSDVHIYSFGGMFPGTETEAYEEWSDFSVGPGPNYILHVGSLTTWAYGSDYPNHPFNESSGHGFSTYDVPRDSCPTLGDCSKARGNGGFWFHCCSNLNPTGIYVRRFIYADSGMHNVEFLGKSSLQKMTIMYRKSAA